MAIRHAFQAELYGLTPAQRNATITQITNFLAGRAVVEASSVREQTSHGDIEVLVEATFSLKSDGDAVFDQAETRAQNVGAGVGTNSGLPSYVRMRSVDDVARTVTMRLSQAPGWVESTTVESLDSLRQA
jgi:hypothetical protein